MGAEPSWAWKAYANKGGAAVTKWSPAAGQHRARPGPGCLARVPGDWSPHPHRHQATLAQRSWGRLVMPWGRGARVGPGRRLLEAVEGPGLCLSPLPCGEGPGCKAPSGHTPHTHTHGAAGACLDARVNACSAGSLASRAPGQFSQASPSVTTRRPEPCGWGQS